MMEVFDSLGIADRVLARGFPVRGIRLVRGGREIACIETRLARDAHPSTRPDLPYPSAATVNQAIVEGVLREKLSELGGHVECQRELLDYEENPDGLVVQVVDVGSAAVERVSAKWLVGCDGAHSIVRKLLQLPLEVKEYPEHWLLADVHLKGQLPDAIGILWLNDQGLLAAIPFNDPGLFRLYAVVTPDAQGNVQGASVELFQRLFAERGGNTTTKLGEPVWLSNFMVHHRMVPYYRKGHAFVSGDAAHIHSPVGGQGMNTGIQDTYNLGWKLALAVSGMAPEALLDTYEDERSPVARQVLKETDINQRVAISHGPITEFLLNHIVLPLLSFPSLGERYLNLAVRRGSELDVTYRSSRLPEQYNHFGKGPEAGDRAPDGQLLDRSGQTTSLFAHFRTPHFRLLLFQGRSSPANVADLASIGLRLREASGGLVRAYLIVGPQGATSVLANDLILLRDPEHGTHTTYGASSSCLYLVRPDGYIGFRSRTADESKLIDYLRRNFALGYMA